MALSSCATRHELSRGGGPASISDGASVIVGACVERRRRIVRGLTKVTEKGSCGFSSYSVPGNSVARPLTRVTSTLLNDSVVLRRYLSHCNVPLPVAGSKLTTRLPTK